MSPKHVAETGEPNQTCSTSVDYPQFAQTLYRMPFMPTLRILFRQPVARDEGMHTSTASHHRDTVQMLSESNAFMGPWDMTGQPHAGNCWHGQYFRLISILFPFVLILDLQGVLYPNRSTIHNVA